MPEDVDVDLHSLMLSDYVPETAVVRPRHIPDRAAVGAIDVHNHLGHWASRVEVEASDVNHMVGIMDECNISAIVNLDGMWETELEANLDRYDRAYPGRFVTFCRVDWADCQTAGWPARLAESIRDSAARGAAGLKIAKELGLRVRDESSQLLFCDDARLDPLWDEVAGAELPVLIHVGDPVAFFRPLDSKNERLEQLLRRPEWYFHGPEFPSLESILEGLERLVERRSDVTFIGAHVGCYPENLDWVDRMLRTYPNFNVDIAARIEELGRRPYRTRELMLTYPTRVLFGTDIFPRDTVVYRNYFEFLQTNDEYFPTSSYRWHIYGVDLPSDVLAAVEAGNARRLIPRLR